MQKKEFVQLLASYHSILLHIPHASTCFPTESGFSADDLDAMERLLIDYYTDELFGPLSTNAGATSIRFPYCRLYSDVERLVNDPLENAGLGIRYSRKIVGSDGSLSLREFCTKEQAFCLYADFHAEVSKQMMHAGDGLLLIDCHSFSALPNLLNSNPPDTDICIGFNDDDTCPDEETLRCIVRHFSRRGYKVGLNNPFSNSKTFSVPIKYHSVMIEVNKRLYMNEQTQQRTKGYYTLRTDIQALYPLLLRK